MDIIENLGIEVFPAIVVICLLIGFLCKASPLDDRWIPIVCGFCGGILGIVSMMVSEAFPTKDPILAVAVGIMSGLAATGLHQAVWQWLKKEYAPDIPEDEPPDDDANAYTGLH